MISANDQPSREDILDNFSMESDSGHATLERYLRDYPQYAPELINLWHELAQVENEDETPLSDADWALINRAWLQHVEAAPDIVDPFSNLSATEQKDLARNLDVPRQVISSLSTLSVSEQRELALRLEVPRQVITAFRECKVEIASVPNPFLERFASALNSTVEMLRNVLAQPPASELVRSYKADDRPEVQTPVTFEQLLIDADVPQEKRVLLMKGEN
jgi:hypothetical protein